MRVCVCVCVCVCVFVYVPEDLARACRWLAVIVMNVITNMRLVVVAMNVSWLSKNVKHVKEGFVFRFLDEETGLFRICIERIRSKVASESARDEAI